MAAGRKAEVGAPRKIGLNSPRALRRSAEPPGGTRAVRSQIRPNAGKKAAYCPPLPGDRSRKASFDTTRRVIAETISRFAGRRPVFTD